MTTKFEDKITPISADNLNGIFTEPPNDGFLYARTFGEWRKTILTGKKLYNIEINASNCTITMDFNQACAGDTVAFVLTPQSASTLIAVTVAGATELTYTSDPNGVKNYTFTMPSQNVIIRAALSTAKYAVKVTTSGTSAQYGGTASVSPSSGISPGTKVTGNYFAKSGSMRNTIYSTPQITFTSTSNQANYTSGTFEFIMPDYDMSIDVNFCMWFLVE